MDLNVTEENVGFFQALASETRIKIIKILRHEEKNVKDLAEMLGASSTIIAKHVNKLEEAGIIKSRNISATRGLQKVCKLDIEKVSLYFESDFNKSGKIKHISIPIGSYSSYNFKPTCGIASTESIIGNYDDPRYFSNPEHYKANLLWFTDGWIEYPLPSYIFDCKSIKSIKFSMEICSEYPECKSDYKSDIYFSLNKKPIGRWTSPGNPSGRRGRYNPIWWIMGSEYGYKIEIIIDETGTQLNGEKVTDAKIADIKFLEKKDSILKIVAPPIGKTENSGGFTIFGKGFGDHDINLELEIEYY
jgi:predicted transcriptional regulator